MVKLMKMTYTDNKAEVRLETYADTVVLEKDGDKTYLAAMCFGGYPESVRGMSDAIEAISMIYAWVTTLPAQYLLSMLIWLYRRLCRCSFKRFSEKP